MRHTLALALIALLLAPAPAALAQGTAVSISTFANLPATCEPSQPYICSDCNATCTGGSGSRRWCFCNTSGNGYEADPGGTPGTDSVGTAQLDDDADTPLSGEYVRVDTVDQAGFEYRTAAETLADIGAEGDLANSAGLAAALSDETGTGLACFNDTPTLLTPTIADFTNAAHDHADAAGGGDVALAGTSTATTAAQGDNDTSIATTAFVMNEIRGAHYWSAKDLEVDGTKCKPWVSKSINSGPRTPTVDCDDDAASILEGSIQDERYDGGTVTFTLLAAHTNASPSGILDFDFACSCRGNDDAMDNTLGTAQNASITFATQNDIMHSDTAAVTCNGTCAAGDTIFWRATMDATATTATNIGDVEILGVSYVEN